MLTFGRSSDWMSTAPAFGVADEVRERGLHGRDQHLVGFDDAVVERRDRDLQRRLARLHDEQAAGAAVVGALDGVAAERDRDLERLAQRPVEARP